jgi:phospholipase C
LIKSTYEALRNSPIWKNSLLIITYDEHGGFYDHVHPPAAKPPGDTAPDTPNNKFQFMFDQYGVRVPAIVISGYSAHTIDDTLFDHSSVPATLEAIYGMLPLTKRDGNANNVTALAALPSLRDTPTKLPSIAKLSQQEEAALLDTPPPLNEAITPVDGGNLPGFLQVVLKADLEREPTKTSLAQTALVTEFAAIQTRADARAYIERKLPGLLAGNGGLIEV